MVQETAVASEDNNKEAIESNLEKLSIDNNTTTATEQEASPAAAGSGWTGKSFANVSALPIFLVCLSKEIVTDDEYRYLTYASLCVISYHVQ